MRHTITQRLLFGLLAALALVGTAGCTDEYTSGGKGDKVPLRLTASFLSATDTLQTRATTITTTPFEVKIALSSSSGFATNAKTYLATDNGSGSITFAPQTDQDKLIVSRAQTTTALTIWGEHPDGRPLFYSSPAAILTAGAVSVSLDDARSQVAVRVKSQGKYMTAETFDVSTKALRLPKKEANGKYVWITSGEHPELEKDTQTTTSAKNTAAEAISSVQSTEWMTICPEIVQKITQVFTLTIGGNAYDVTIPGESYEFSANNRYLITVDFDKEVAISNITIASMTQQDDLDIRERPGIYNLKDLKNFRDAWNTDGDSGFDNDKYLRWGDKTAKTISLLVDIDMNSEDWTPIANFSGTFDGEGHTIRNLSVVGSTDPSGFFSSVSGSGSGIKNLNIENASVSGSVCGALAGTISSSKIINCAVLGTIQIDANTGTTSAGGLIGESTGGRIERCMVSGSGAGSSITSTSSAGGICGKGGSQTYVLACNVNNISSIAASDASTGGTIVGTGDNGVSVYGCVAYNIEALTGTSFGNMNAASTGNYFCKVANLTTTDEGYTPIMESLNTYTAHLNAGLYQFNQLGNEDIAYIYQGAPTPATTSPILVAGTPVALPDDANFDTRAVGIYTGHELVAFAAATTANDATELAKYKEGSTVKIMRDIDMEGITYVPCDISSGITVQGYNGQQMISNLSGAPALFGKVSGTIKDVIMKDVNLIGENCAAFARTGTPTIEYCKVIGGTITSTGNIVFGNNLSNNNAGGIAAYPTSATITACIVQDMKIEGPRIGGIIGTNTGGNCNIYSCAVINSSFTTTANNIWNGAGGIIGRQTHGNNNKHITSCFLYGVRGAKAIYIGSYTSTNWFYMDRNYWADMGGTTKDVSNTGSDTWKVTDCGQMTDLSETITNLNIKVATGYEWQAVQGQPCPSIVRQ